jgi:DNA-binding transcriptional MerR regulator
LNKAPDAFRTISEVAEELDLPQHVLRFWESRFPHIKPLKRGGGRRYYRPEDIDLLRGIRRLLYADGYTIRGVQRILREQGVRIVQSVGQGQEALNLVAVPDDSPDGEDGHSGAPFNFLAPPALRPPDDGEDESGRPRALAMARPQPTPKNGPIPEAGLVVVARTAMLEAAKIEPAPVADASVAPVAAVSVAISPVAVGAPSPPGMAAQDLDRLKHALAELEACRRLLTKTHDEGR